MENNKQTEIVLLTDKQWSAVDGEICRVIDFTPMSGLVRDGQVSSLDKTTPYASVTLECKKLPSKTTGFIGHKIDFLHLWLAFKEKEQQHDREVLITWSKKHYKPNAKFVFKSFTPKLWVMLCHKGAFELLTNPDHKPNLEGLERWKVEGPVIEWGPEGRQAPAPPAFSPTETKKIKYCTKCQTECPSDDTYCSFCHTELIKMDG